MNRHNLLIALLLALVGGAQGIAVRAQDAPLRLREDNIPEIVAALTLEEKANLVVGAGFKSMWAGLSGSKDVLVPGAAGETRAVPRLGIPKIVLSDGPAGVRIEPVRKREKGREFYATAFPTGTILACTWDEETVRKVGVAMGNEALEYGVDVLLAPGLNIHRNPLNGRNFEYYSEDPVLSGKMAAAMIRGVQSNGVGTSAKHYAANSQETNRSGNDARIDMRTLRELYLRGFEIAVRESAPWTVMSSYNKINGEYTQSDPWLLTDVLRGEWGFDGLVMTDWTGKRETDRQVAAGNDLMEPGMDSQVKELVRKVNRGELSDAFLDLCVSRVLELIVRTPRFHGYAYSNRPDLAAHAKVARKAAGEGIVLLKNDGGTLPLGPGIRRVALFGVAGYEPCIGGTGSGYVHAPYVVTVPEALRSAGIELDGALEKVYGDYLARHSKKGGIVGNMLGTGIPAEFPVADWVDASRADMAVFVIGRQAGEEADRRVEDDFLLTATERQNLTAVAEAFHAAGKKVVVVLNIGGVIETASWKALADALVVTWQPGEEGAHALVEVLQGQVNPSGKLTMTFPNNYLDIPSSSHFPYDVKDRGSRNPFVRARDKGRPLVDYTEYAEGLNVGYRYFAGKPVSFPFGFGLSYTTFSYDGLDVSRAADGGLTVRITVTNTGSRAGREVVQIYIHDRKPAAEKPALELKGFAKTGLLAPGGSETLEIRIAPYVLPSYIGGQWIMPEAFTVLAGASVEDIRLHADLPA